MPLKKTDYQVKKGTLPLEFQRGVQINGKSSVLTVVLRLNYKKGLHTVLPRLNHDQITGNPEDDQNTLQTLSDLIVEAIRYALDWRREWDEAQKDPNQPSLFDQAGEEITGQDEVPGERQEGNSMMTRRPRARK